MAIERVIYNGVPMIAEWPAMIEAAQLNTNYLIDGKLFNRVKYGEEADDWGADRQPCHDCSVVKNQYHVGPACDVEQCPCCGGQVMSCDCDISLP